MQNDKQRFKKDFKKRLYGFTLKPVESLETLPKDNVSRRLGDQLLRSGTSIIANYVEGQAASSIRDFTNFFNIALNRRTRANSGWRCSATPTGPSPKTPTGSSTSWTKSPGSSPPAS